MFVLHMSNLRKAYKSPVECGNGVGYQLNCLFDKDVELVARVPCLAARTSPPIEVAMRFATWPSTRGEGLANRKL